MSEVQSEGKQALAPGKEIVNDFQIIVATVNGTGSQTANTALMRALFRMGIPVNGKNILPSNIQGLPTWFAIRLSKDGYIARREISEVLVAMNRVTIEEDIEKLPAGGICIYPQEWKIAEKRSDIVYYAVPARDVVKSCDVPANLRDYVTNMVYVGALSALLEIDLEEIRNALEFHFAGKIRPVEMNMTVVQASFDWCMDNLAKSDPYRVERLNLTEGMLILDGNSACALGAVFGGVTFTAWYPITPSTGMVDALREYMQDLRIDPETGKATYAIVQAEDELAAIGMIIGAGWAGARSMTSTSGPGLSLMSEFAGLAYFAEVPCVIWDVQRVGPSTGLPTRTSQGDLLMAYTLGHGDTRHVVLLPSCLEECFEFGWRSLNLSTRLQTLVMTLTDLDLGMNPWMSKRFEYPDEPIDHGKVLTAEELERIEDYGRYKDVDGDGVAYRTLPGTDHPSAAYFTRGTGHDEYAVYSEDPDVWVANIQRIERKFELAKTIVPQPILHEADNPQFGLIAYGTTDAAVTEGRDRLKEEGVEFDYMRIRALPAGEAVEEFLTKHDRIYVFENNTDGQMAQILSMEFPAYAPKIVSLAHLDGLPLTARRLVSMVMEKENK